MWTVSTLGSKALDFPQHIQTAIKMQQIIKTPTPIPANIPADTPLSSVSYVSITNVLH